MSTVLAELGTGENQLGARGARHPGVVRLDSRARVSPARDHQQDKKADQAREDADDCPSCGVTPAFIRYRGTGDRAQYPYDNESAHP